MKKWLLLLSCLLWSNLAAAKVEFKAVIPVDVEAADSVLAKDQAMLQAQRQAFLDVAGKLTTEENVAKLNELSDEAILHFIKAVGVEDEKAGGTKYKATLTVELNEPLMRDYMLENEMIEAEITSLMVIPVMRPRASDHVWLWEEANDWRARWKSKGLIKFGSLEMHTISERFRDIDTLSAENALYMSTDLFDKISQMNRSDRIYVIYAETMPNGDLKVTVKNEKNKSEDNFTVYNDRVENIYDKAIEKSVMFVSNMEREAQNTDGAITSGTVNAVYIYQNMKDWLDKNAEILKLPMVEGIDTKSFGGGKVHFAIRYTGSLDDLWLAMQELGLSHEQEDNYYIIR